MHQLVVTVQWINVIIIVAELLIVIRNMKNRVHAFLYMLCVSMLVSSFSYLMTLYCTTEESYLMTYCMSWCGKVFTVIASLQLCSCLCRFTLPKWVETLELIFAVITCAVITTTRRTGLFYQNITLTKEGDHMILSYGMGPWLILWDTLVICVIIICLVLLFRSLRKGQSVQNRNLNIVIIIALYIEIVIAIFTRLPISRYYDFNYIGFSLCSLLIIISTFRYNLMDIETVTKELIVDELSAGVISTDKSGDVAYYNKKAMKIFPEMKDDSRGVIERIRESIDMDEPLTVEDRVYTFEEMKPEKSTLDGSKIFVLMDSTVHYNHLREMEEQKRIADDANKAKSYFLASMSHEIRTPINTVLGMDEMILRESNDSTVREYAMDIRKAGRTLLSLINDILDLSKIESGRMEIIPVPYDLSSMIYDVSNMVRFMAEDKELTFEVTVSPDIPSRPIGDDVRVRQILMNLLSNAVKYTNSGNIWLRVSLKSINEGNDEDENSNTAVLHFEVEDTGVGIRMEDMVKLFSNFQRIEDLRNRSIQGTGLGVPITMRLLGLMGSELEMKSDYGKGSLFFFDLEQGIADRKPVGDFEKNIKKLKSDQHAYIGSFTAPDARILVVDDNSMNRKVFVSLLKQTRIRIDESESGQGAVALASRDKFDIIFMDHMMPGMDGIEAMKRIRSMKNGPCANTPIIMLTANAVAGSKENYLREGFDGFLAKPVAPGVLESTIREILPDSKVIPASPEDMRQEQKAPAPEEENYDFPVIFGLDWKVAMMRLQNKEILDSVLKEFDNTIDHQADKLQGFKDGLPETFADYRILVHAMKSASAVVGIIPLSGMAAILEKAAAAEDEETVNRLHDIFIREWRSYKEGLKEYLNTDETAPEDKEDIDEEILKALLAIIEDAMEEMDIDAADEAVEKLSSYRLPEGAAREFEELKAAVSQLDQDMAAEVLARINNAIA
ncbi:MAG: response regulator [Lachnospiraceae bacterium]|nr:response regulator [Lachnospiraceae bacterium]